MIKTVKVKKQMRLDELIKYVWDNVKGSCKFESTNGECIAEFDAFGKIQIIMRHFNYLHPSMVFTVEVEEEVTEDTVFDSLIEITADGGYIDHGYNISVSDVKSQHSIRFYTLINKKLEIIWEAE